MQYIPTQRNRDFTLASPNDCAAFSLEDEPIDWTEVWSQHALRRKWCERWVEGAIFPREMVYFLSECDRNEARVVIECGRQDGFSTWILDQYAQCHFVEVHSIDHGPTIFGLDRVTQYRGDAFELLPKILRGLPRTTRIALLIDGPKDASALALVSALALDRRIVLIALHNRALGDMPGATFYEDNTPCGPQWNALANREHELKAVRSLTQSSLAILTPTYLRRLRMAHACRSAFHLYQPMLLRLGWRTLGYRATKQLFLQSFRLWGS